MKTINYFILAASFALALACAKAEIIEPGTEPSQEKEMVEIRIGGTLDKEVTKTAYDADGKMTWCDGDQIGLIVYEGDYTNQNRNSYTLLEAYGDITNNGRHATFYGTYDPFNALLDDHKNTTGWLSTSFAVYPIEVTQINDNNYYNCPFIKMPSNVTGLASSIILIGTPNSDTPSEVTDFLFKTAMAVLKINISGIPASATSIVLRTAEKDTYPVDGDFTLVKGQDGIVTIDFDKYQDTWGNGYQAVDISSEGAISSRDFFFNVPVGTYPANTLSVEVKQGDLVLMKKTISKALTLPRNECLSVPALNYRLADYNVSVSGSISNPLLSTVNPWSSSGTIRTHISNEPLSETNYDKGNWKEGNRFSGNQSGWNLTQLTDNNGNAFLSATTGTYYLQYIVCGDMTQPDALTNDNVLAFGSVPFKYMSASDPINDPSVIIGTYATTAYCGWHQNEISTMTIAASDDTSLGNVMITTILGHDTKLYGSFEAGVLTVSEDQTWFIDGNSATHRLCDSWDGNYDGSWSLVLAASNDMNLILASSWLVNQYFTTQSTGTDHYYNTFDCVKQ